MCTHTGLVGLLGSGFFDTSAPECSTPFLTNLFCRQDPLLRNKGNHKTERYLGFQRLRRSHLIMDTRRACTCMNINRLCMQRDVCALLLRSLMTSCIFRLSKFRHSFINPFIRSLFHSHNLNSFHVIQSVIYSFFIHAFVHSFFQSVIHSCLQSFFN